MPLEAQPCPGEQPATLVPSIGDDRPRVKLERRPDVDWPIATHIDPAPIAKRPPKGDISKTPIDQSTLPPKFLTISILGGTRIRLQTNPRRRNNFWIETPTLPNIYRSLANPIVTARYTL
jgi:hypothetical protein